MEFTTLLLQLSPIIVLIYFYFSRKFSFWSERGVNGPRPWFPLGNLFSYIWTGQVKLETEWIRKYGKVYGVFQTVKPVLTIADHELIKQVLVKDFPSFVNREKNPFEHEIWSSNLFMSYDEQWRRVRAIVSPTFTSGKLKGMHALMNRAVDKLGDYFDSVIQTKQGQINAKEVITGFTIEVIASTSFATEIDANNDRNKQKSPFVKHGTELMDLNVFQIIAYFVAPKWLNQWMGTSLGFRTDSFDFFINMSKEIVKQRKLNPGKNKRNDLVQLLMDAFVYEDELDNKNYDKLAASTEDSKDISENGHSNGSNKKTLTENEIIAQCILFFIAGFETTASTISNCLYHLAIEPEVQSRLRDELNEALQELDEHSGEYFEKVNTKIPYLEAAIKETLRIAPPVTRLQRRVNVEGYKLGGIELENDQQVDIAVYGVHHSAEYYPEPERFNPSRFMPENKHLLVPYTYLPFGAGPRNCIGLRFAYQEIKLCLAKIIRQFRFDPTPETKIPLDYANMDVLIVQNIPLRVSRL